MYCPRCTERTRVVRSRHRGDDEVERIRICEACEYVFRTRERAVRSAEPGTASGRRHGRDGDEQW
ncbi:transcriptional regulator NrdR family protein [Desulfobaculum xiamenense]|uniref:Transcriptional regulator NrdR family protein n=2 Tax=Desulfobaculum xiamenense TaxID=995050 RepID=A0A846QJY4_9BACT|nr:transcriptional regulator NrdR family protein [Desulfobaculum xiamenense]